MNQSRTFPGAIGAEGREFFYVQVYGSEGFKEIANAAIEQTPEVPMPKSGGVLEEKAKVQLGNRDELLAISFRGDLDRIRAKYQAFCEKTGRKWGIVKDRELHVSDGTVLLPFECQVEFWD